MTVIGLTVAIAFSCLRSRRMRFIARMEAVRLRHGPFNEQFYAWIKLLRLLLFAGVSLNAIGVVMSGVFNSLMGAMLLNLGVVVTIMICVAIMTLAHLGIGWGGWPEPSGVVTPAVFWRTFDFMPLSSWVLLYQGH